MQAVTPSASSSSAGWSRRLRWRGPRREPARLPPLVPVTASLSPIPGWRRTRPAGGARLLAVVLRVALDHDDVVLRVEPDVDGRAVGLGDLDLVRRAVLVVGLDAVGGATAGGLQGRLLRGVGLLLRVLVARGP